MSASTRRCAAAMLHAGAAIKKATRQRQSAASIARQAGMGEGQHRFGAGSCYILQLSSMVGKVLREKAGGGGICPQDRSEAEPGSIRR
jgi:hypothetical protein